ncbi:interferon-induced very large GTPase 1-like isoform X2 [Megalops cyprinoides]|nr:interferon-induced very large GTPase 1-like isoform X2 [Megalops cyprinoides]
MEPKEHTSSALSEKVFSLLRGISELRRNGKDRKDSGVQDKEKEIQNLLRAPEHEWLPPDKTIQELEEFVKQFVTDCKASAETSVGGHSPDIIRNASGGLALRGILLSKDLQELSKERKTLLEVPKNVTFVNSSKAPQDLTVNFECLQQEQHFQQCVHSTGLNISGGVSGKRWGCTAGVRAGYDSSQQSDESSSSNKETVYASILKYSSVPIASCEFSAKDLRLSGPALDSLRQLQDTFKYAPSSALKEKCCAEFLYSYGSHANCGTLVFGGIFETKAETSNYKKDEKSTVFQMLSDVLHSSVNVNLFGLVDIDNTVSKTSSSSNYSKGYTREQLKSTRVSIQKVGGPPTASDVTEWKRGLLSKPETWQVIDRGSLEELVPVWVILSNHVGDLEDCQLLAQNLRKSWEKETQLFDKHSDVKLLKSLREIQKKITSVKMWNDQPEEEFLKNCEGYVSECQQFKLSLACSDLLWYEKFLCATEVQRFIDKAAGCIDQCRNKKYLTMMLSSVLEPIELIQTSKFPNIAQIRSKLSDFQGMTKPSYITLESAMRIVKETKTEFVKASPEDIEAHQKLCLDLHKTIDALQLNLKQKEKYADVLVTGILSLVFTGPHRNSKSSLTEKDLDSLFVQMGKIENILETLKPLNDTQREAFLIYEALKSFREVGWQEKDCTAGIKILCKRSGKDISPRVREVAFTDSGNVKTDLQNLEDQLICLFKNELLPSTQKATEQKKELEDFLTSLNQTTCIDTGHLPTTRNSDFTIQELLQQLGMNEYYPGKLKLRDVLEIGLDSVMDQTGTESNRIMWNFIRKVLMANSTARKVTTTPRKNADTETEERQASESDLLDVDELFMEEEKCSETSFNPLDITVMTLLCSDQLLQQELMSKMTMCQFAVPLLIPNSLGKEVSLFLWALLSIVKKWTPKSLAQSRGFIEENIAVKKMPTVSFVRIGTCKESKSKILNEMLSDGQLSFFVNRHMEQGDVKRKISDGVAEVCWYLPSGNDTLDTFSEAFAVVNLRGDALEHSTQLRFLTEVSSATFVFVDKIGNEEKAFITSHLSSLKMSRLFLVMNTSQSDKPETAANLKILIPLLELKKDQYVQLGKSNTDILKNLRERVSNEVTQSIKKKQKLFSLDEMADVARGQGIFVDEDEDNCKKGKAAAKEIMTMMEENENVAYFKKNSLCYQGDQWKMWSKIDKEQSRLRARGAESAVDYIEKLQREKRRLREEQLGFKVSNFMRKFIEQMHSQNHAKMFFMQWLKLELDSRSRKDLKVLHDRYKQLCDDGKSQTQELKDLDGKISESSLGLEHLLREVGQIYEATANNTMPQERGLYQQLPQYAAKLMLDGIPLELIDGDASNIPLQWVTNVLEEIENIIGKESRMFVVTVLGVQSTGKSTLLNTMFGLQFAVSSGRCTRGAFMQLLRVKGDFKKQLGCDFVMVIDTEGLKAPELAQMDDSYEHDNELATLVIGLSDLTLVNMSMENSAEMRDILQIVVHAFIRMKEVGRRPNCQFVHQNAGDIAAHEKNIRDRRHFFDQLNEMTKAAARMEEREGQYSSFGDVMDYDASKSNWYIGSLWHGNPPMAAVNTGYCKDILDLKLYIFHCLEQRQNTRKPGTVRDFGKWMKSIWAAVKKENFIFSFKNSLVAEAYNELSLKYRDWEWELREFIMSWTQESENKIKNASQMELSTILSDLERDLNAKINEKVAVCIQKLEEFFNSGKDNVHLIERYKAEFQHSLEILGRELKNSSISKCSDTISRQKALQKLNQVQRGYQQQIENQVNSLLMSCKKQKTLLQESELEYEFENMWREVTLTFPNSTSDKRSVANDMENALCDAIPAKYQHLVWDNLHLINEDHLDEFTVVKNHLDLKWKIVPEMIKNPFKNTNLAEQMKEHFVYNIKKILDDKVEDNINYDQNFCQEMLRAIDRLLESCVTESPRFNESFKVDFKLHLSGHAVKRFEEMQDRFYQENDPVQKLGRLKRRYLEIFKDTYCKRDQTHKKAEMFCKDCLMPATIQCIESKLGASLLEDLRCNRVSLALSTSKFFHVSLLMHLMEENDFAEYFRYINHYEEYATEWVKKCVLKHCAEETDDGKTRLAGLASRILKQVLYTAKEAVKDAEAVTVSNQIDGFIEVFVKKMDRELVIPTDNLDIVAFQNDGNNKTFAEAVLDGINELEKDIEEQITNWDVEETVLNLSTKPTEELINSLLNCKKQCPFCGVPCERAGLNHSDHFSEYHIPDGLCGYTQNTSKKLSTYICTISVSSGECFLNEDTDYRYVPYRNYKSVNEFYRSWQIQSDSSYKASSYWKYVFYRFNNEFAHRYAAEPATIPEGWKISEEQVKTDLEEAYQVSLDAVSY